MNKLGTDTSRVEKQRLLPVSKPSRLGRQADGRVKAYGWSDHVSSFASCVGTVGERRMQEESMSGRRENIRASLIVLIHPLKQSAIVPCV